MRRKGALKKKPAGRVIMDLRQDVMVWRIGKPFEAFSMMALHSFYQRVSFIIFVAGVCILRIW